MNGTVSEQGKVHAGLGRQELLNQLQESKLLSAAEFDRASALPPSSDGAPFSQALVAAGLVTAHQIEAVANRRFEELLIGNYEVLDKLGAGGMGTVFKARHRRMKRIVALKVLSRNLCKDDTFVLRFQREVETVARLTHPNIVMAYDADEGELGHFLVMEFVNGPDLSSIVQKQGPMSLADAVSCILQSARGMEYVHAQGMIHRDIKPANLLRDGAGFVKITDLGLARLSSPTGSGNSALTQAGGILGTVDYMPPEQAIDSSTIDARADIYSLGCTLHFLLLGQAPYQGATMMATLWKHRESPIASLAEMRKDVPPALDELYRRMMAKTPAERCQTMTEVVRTLEAVQASLPVAPAMPIPSAVPPGGVAVSRPTDVRGANGGDDPSLAAGELPDYRSEAAQHRARQTMTVLLVEPSRTQAGIIRRYLNAQNIGNVVIVATGQDALNAFRANRPDAMICAMHLNDMTGVQLAKQVRDELQGAELSLVLVSSESESQEAGALSKSGLAVLLHKPFTPEQLLQALSIATPQQSHSIVAHTLAGLRAKSLVQNPPKDYGKLRVLIADDSTASRMHMRKILSSLGVTQFVEAVDGAQAVAKIAVEKFDLIVTDFNMPHMDGRALLSYLKQNPTTAAVPVIMVTTESNPVVLEAVRQLGVAAVCDKTFPAEEVRKILDRL